MSPFAKGSTKRAPSSASRFFARRAVLVFALCLLAGLGVVAWRAYRHSGTARAVARAEASAHGAAIELQFSQASSAAEVLATLARQGRGALTNFQKIAAELLAARPAVASLELEPGGIVSDVVPRAGHERAFGLNVLTDASQRATANEAMARRVLTVAGPVTLDHGERGFVARAPVYQRALDGRESFWGFVAVTMRLPEALARAQVDDLLRQDYNYAFFVPAPARQTPVVIASHGLSSLQDAVLQPVRAQNLEFRLALKPRNGWIDRRKVVLDSLAVLLLSALISLSVNLVESRGAVEAELREATQRFARETADRNQAQTECREAKERLKTAQAELAQTQLAQRQAESKADELLERLNAGAKASDEAVRATRAELNEAQAALVNARERIAQLLARSEAATLAEQEAALAQKQLQQRQAAMAELEVAARAARESAETSAAKLGQMKQAHAEMTARLRVAEAAEARVKELSGLLQQAREELERRPTATLTKVAAPAEPEETNAPAVAEQAPAAVSTGTSKPPKRKKARRDDQPDLFGNGVSALEAAVQSDVSEVEMEKQPSPAVVALDPVVEPQQDKSAPARRLPATPPLDPAQFRPAMNQILFLLAEKDPGAKDCLRDNRTTFRSAFAPEAFVDFEQLVKSGDYDAALEQLKKAARKHGLAPRD